MGVELQCSTVGAIGVFPLLTSLEANQIIYRVPGTCMIIYPLLDVLEVSKVPPSSVGEMKDTVRARGSCPAGHLRHRLSLSTITPNPVF